VVLRVSGKRTLAKLNVFDFVVTVALGSTLATILLNSTVSWAEGAVALAVLAGFSSWSPLWPHESHDRICRGEVLWEAWERLRANRGAAGAGAPGGDS
jgi:hypothetical protein